MLESLRTEVCDPEGMDVKAICHSAESRVPRHLDVAGCHTCPMVEAPDWFEITRRNARSVQTTIGWIYWDPGATARYIELGLPEVFAEPLGYMAARCAPLAAAGPDAVIAAFGSISARGIRGAFNVLGHDPERFEQCRRARDEAVVEGLHAYAPGIVGPLVEIGPELWSVVEQLPVMGRVLMAAHLAVPRPDDPLLSGWHAINCIREWRGDTHWAIVVAAGLTHPEASILHNAHMDYETDWMPTSRGSTPEEIEAGWTALAHKGLAEVDQDWHRVLPHGRALRQRIEDDTDRLTTLPWELLGEDRSRWFSETFEPPCEALLARVDETAGPNYQPASRLRT